MSFPSAEDTMKNTPRQLTAKQERIVARCLREMFSGSAFESTEKIRGLQFSETILRLVAYSAEHRLKALISLTASNAHERMVNLLFDDGVFGDVFLRSDIWSSVRNVYEACLTGAVKPASAKEWISLLASDVYESIEDYTFVVAIQGVQLKDVKEMKLGKLMLVRSAEDFIKDSNVTVKTNFDGRLAKWFCEFNCLVGNVTGTYEFAKTWFSEQAQLTAAMLAVEAGAAYDRGPTGFNIAAIIDRPSPGGGSFFLHWTSSKKYLGRTSTFGSGQSMVLDATRVAELTAPGAFDHAFTILQGKDRSDLEDAIVRAVYWYGDAHRDQTNVMRFVKFWTCIECLLGGPGDQITESLALGLVVVLTFGHFNLFQRNEFGVVKAKAKSLYAKRSRAVHQASHTHVSSADTVAVSQWAAWSIYNAISFANADLPSRRALWRAIQEVGSKEGCQVAA